jgi:hypothetical protein
MTRSFKAVQIVEIARLELVSWCEVRIISLALRHTPQAVESALEASF